METNLNNHLGANVRTIKGKKGLIHHDQHKDGKHWVYPYRTGEFEPGLYDYTIISYF